MNQETVLQFPVPVGPMGIDIDIVPTAGNCSHMKVRSSCPGRAHGPASGCLAPAPAPHARWLARTPQVAVQQSCFTVPIAATANQLACNPATASSKGPLSAYLEDVSLPFSTSYDWLVSEPCGPFRAVRLLLRLCSVNAQAVGSSTYAPCSCKLETKPSKDDFPARSSVGSVLRAVLSCAVHCDHGVRCAVGVTLVADGLAGDASPAGSLGCGRGQ